MGSFWLISNIEKGKGKYGIRYDWNRNGSSNYLHFDFRDDRIQEDSKWNEKSYLSIFYKELQWLLLYMKYQGQVNEVEESDNFNTGEIPR